MNAKRTLAKSSEKRGPKAPDADGQISEPKSPLRLALSANLSITRDEIGISQRDLAKAAGVNHRLIWEIESRARNVTLETVTTLAKATGKSEWDLLARKLLIRKNSH